MGLKAIYCNNDVLEPTMAKSGAGASASSDFSGKDIIGYAAVLAAITALSGCISSTVTETSKTEVQHSASGEGGKPTQDAAAPASGNDELPPHLVQVVKDGQPNFEDMPRNYDNSPITCFGEWRDFSRGATPNRATYGELGYSQSGTYVFEFQGVDHQGDKDIAHFDVYFSSFYNLGADGKDRVVKKGHIDLEVDHLDRRLDHLDLDQPDWKQYIQIANSKKDTTSGPIAVLNFPSNGLYSNGVSSNWDFKLVAHVTKMQDGYPGTGQPNAVDSATLEVNAFIVEKK